MTRPDVDHSLDPDLDRVAQIALDLVEKIRDEDPRRMFEQLCLLAELHPAKYAQITMALTAFVNPDESSGELIDRVWAITDSRVERHLVLVVAA